MSYFRKTNSYKTTESEKVTKPEGTIEFDMKGTRRKRDNHLDQIMGELSIGKAITPISLSNSIPFSQAVFETCKSW